MGQQQAGPTVVGSFDSKRWGKVTATTATYGSRTGPLAVLLALESGEPLTKLSVNMYRPECSHDSRDLPADCFYVKQWDQEDIAAEALASGLFVQRDDLPVAESGFVSAPAWQIVVPQGSAA